MATLNFGNAAEIVSSGNVGQFTRYWEVSDVNSEIRKYIPKHSKINSVKYSFEAYQTIALGSTKADGKIFLGSGKDSESAVIAGGTENVPKGSWTTISKSTTSYVNTSGANAGEFKSTYSGMRLYYSIEAFVIRTMKMRNIYVVYDYAEPIYVISLSLNNNDAGVVSGAGLFRVTTSDVTKTIIAAANTGYRFVKWSDGNTNANRKITISQNNISAYETTLTLQAIFEPIPYTISVSASPSNGGTVTGGGTYNYNTSVTLTATPKTGYKFVKWSDGNTNASRTIKVTGAASYTAEFAKIAYTATFKNYDGTVLQTVTVEHGSTPSYTGSAPTKAQDVQYTYAFSGWSPSLGAITADTTYTAQFTATKRKYTITTSVNPSGAGTVTGSGTYEYGTTKTLAATANDGYEFVEWSDGVKTASRSITVSGNATYTAIFQETSKTYCGTEKVTAVYCGTQKLSEYCGTEKIL